MEGRISVMAVVVGERVVVLCREGYIYIYQCWRWLWERVVVMMIMVLLPELMGAGDKHCHLLTGQRHPVQFDLPG